MPEAEFTASPTHLSFALMGHAVDVKRPAAQKDIDAALWLLIDQVTGGAEYKLHNAYEDWSMAEASRNRGKPA